MPSSAQREGRGRLPPFPRPLPRPSPGLGILASPVAAELISVASSADPSGAFLRGAFVSRVFWLVHPSLFCVIPMEPWHEPR